MIVVFIIDTSASMNQKKTPNGLSLLDIAKCGVEHFLKIRGRDASSMRMDRYFLVTNEEVKVGWKDPFSTFLQEVKNLQARDLSSLGPAIKRAFDLLNIFRHQNSLDNYSQGRLPWYIESALLILFTDGSSLSSLTGVHDSLTLPLPAVPNPGSELTKEPFRWDQRLFALLLNSPTPQSNTVEISSKPLPFSGYFPDEPNYSPNQILSSNSNPLNSQITNVPPPNPANLHPLAPMCEVTGGKCQSVSSMKSLAQEIEGSLIPKMQNGVVVNFEPITLPSSPNPSLTSLLSHHKFLFVRSNHGHWPIPEPFLPDHNLSQLPFRYAHPTIRFSVTESEPFIMEGFPFDKYEVEPCNMTKALLASRNSSTCWQTFIMGSSGNKSMGEPFGYLKASSTSATVNLFVLPYNYPKLWPLLDELVKINSSLSSNSNSVSPSNPSVPGSVAGVTGSAVSSLGGGGFNFPILNNSKWRQEFEHYLISIPNYYIPLLRNSLKRFLPHSHHIISHLIPDHLDPNLSYHVSNYLKKLKQQAKVEVERLQASLSSKTPIFGSSTSNGLNSSSGTSSSVGSSSVGSSSSNSSSSSISGVNISSGVQLNQIGNTLNFNISNSLSSSIVGNTSNASFTSSYSSGKNFHHLLQKGNTSNWKSDVNDISEGMDGSMKWSQPSLDIQKQLSSNTQNSSNSNLNLIVKKRRNVFDFERGNLLSQIEKLKRIVLHKQGDHEPHPNLFDESRFSVPIAQMGNYHDALMKRQVLRDVDDEDDKRSRPLFGNPFIRTDKSSARLSQFALNSVDEADEDASPVDSSAPSSPNSSLSMIKKRKRFPASPSSSSTPPLKRSKSLNVQSPSSPSPPSSPIREEPEKQPSSLSTSTSPETPPLVEYENNENKKEEDLTSVMGDKEKQHEELSQIVNQWVKQMKWTLDNTEIHTRICKEIRKPGPGDIPLILQQLSLLQGNEIEKKKLVYLLISDAERFKKYQLVSQLQEFENKKLVT